MGYVHIPHEHLTTHYQWSDRTQSPRKPRTRNALSFTPSQLPHTPIQGNPSSARTGTDLHPPSARQVRAARRQSLLELEEADTSWAKMFFRVRKGIHVLAVEADMIRRRIAREEDGG